MFVYRQQVIRRIGYVVSLKWFSLSCIFISRLFTFDVIKRLNDIMRGVNDLCSARVWRCSFELTRLAWHVASCRVSRRVPFSLYWRRLSLWILSFNYIQRWMQELNGIVAMLCTALVATAPNVLMIFIHSAIIHSRETQQCRNLFLEAHIYGRNNHECFVSAS